MPRLLYFNPENDLALAANDPHYTPPASALQMATDLQRLPLQWAQPDDLILLREFPSPTSPDGVNEACGRWISPQNDTPLPLAAANQLSPLTASRQPTPLTCLPWGWSPLTVTDFLRAGVPASLLPTDDEMQAFRTLSGRATSADVLCRLCERLTAYGYADSIIGEAHVCYTLEEARQWHALWGDSIFKQPWSGSGRGLLPAHDGVLTPKNEAWIKRTLRQQGYVMAEPLYERRHDFALEFWRHDDGIVTFEGLSLFMTTKGGVYAGNIIDTEDGKRRRLSHWVDIQLVDVITSMLEDELSLLPPTFYVGPIGVDMMTCKNPHSNEGGAVSDVLHPCVEINFRLTMGWLALHISPFFD